MAVKGKGKAEALPQGETGKHVLIFDQSAAIHFTLQ